MKYRMRYLEIPILVIILIAGMAASAIAGEDAPKAPEASKAPKAVAESGIYNFGTVPEGKTVKAEFTIKNTGNADLVVEKVKTG